MIRRVLAIVSALSMLLCAGTATLWLLSYFVFGSLSYSRQLTFPALPRAPMAREYNIAVAQGRVRVVAYLTWAWRPGKPWNHDFHRLNHNTVFLPEYRSGFAAESIQDANWYLNSNGNFEYLGNTVTFRDGNWLAAAPLWFIAGMLSIMPVLRLFARRKWHRINPGFCRQCGYDLRASKERCPECGTVIAPLKVQVRN